jgi:hypothetical protein
LDRASITTVEVPEQHTETTGILTAIFDILRILLQVLDNSSPFSDREIEALFKVLGPWAMIV